MKNKILIMITLASVADFVAGAFLLLDDECWKLALAALLLSTFWICSFLWANSELVERTVDKLINKICKRKRHQNRHSGSAIKKNINN